ncbi:hypothetical protein KsCSTR_05190 [Candidatus Kuenenia stuttgartiensis]|uniref:Uncharacterized protein n=1 Tax=Kuenenia stuttgartiensis TaxID=174633 RepID=Q1Q063_KUEST|nr:hypothetical protein KsCSTR_05190 [Candidatus Kuenenia stuttgartiensis]CAJ72723.1 unknown protein [Candidatus Kuenenia stuttgartiensis]
MNNPPCIMCTLLKKHCVNPYATVSFSKTPTTFVRYVLMWQITQLTVPLSFILPILLLPHLFQYFKTYPYLVQVQNYPFSFSKENT